MIYDPVTTTAAGGGFVRQPFAANRIPANRFDRVAANVARYFPLPNAPGDPVTGNSNFVAQGSGLSDSNQIDVKVDENINDRHRFFVRVSRRKLSIEPAKIFPSDIAVAQGGMLEPQIGSGAAFDYTW
ncbi:MAG: TonB-dependent receptor, partial [Bryobacteraceae bacterium]